MRQGLNQDDKVFLANVKTLTAWHCQWGALLTRSHTVWCGTFRTIKAVG